MDAGFPRTGKGWTIWFPLLCATGACSGEGGLVSGPWCNQPGREWDLLISAMAISMVAALLVWLVRGRQLQRWDLRDSPVAPSTTAILWTVALCAVVPAGLLSLSVYTAEPCAPAQKMANIVFLWVGVLGGTALCLVGLFGAKTWYVRGSRQ